MDRFGSANESFAVTGCGPGQVTALLFYTAFCGSNVSPEQIKQKKGMMSQLGWLFSVH
jgi:hypothetical protein